MRQVRYRAVIALDPEGERRPFGHASHADPEYHCHTRDLMVRASSLRAPARSRSFPAELCWDDGKPLHPGDRHVVTITVLDDDAPAFLDAGQRITLWAGSEVGHGTISRRVLTEYGPC
ncbi:MAG TPA: hypothetical protein VK817_22300 [Trebonia sp.]|jgi:hypothetical protein|nr:hypothetical protein [Trebonia sp.]